jgi:predicted ATPase with chaperone activity
MLQTPDSFREALLARLADSSRTVGAEAPASVAPPVLPASLRPLDRSTEAARGSMTEPAPNALSAAEAADAFLPLEPNSFREALLTESDIDTLVLKFLLVRGTANGREIADQIKLPFKLFDSLLARLRLERLVVHKGEATIGDYQYQLTSTGHEQARRHYEHCSYCGAAPVALEDYIAGLKAQSIAGRDYTLADVAAAFEDLLLSPELINQLAQAVHSGKGLFLYGPPGNGKTSIAERMSKVLGEHLWIPRVIGVEGELIRLFDPCNHVEMPLAQGEGLLEQRKIDRRWIRIRRPTIIAGGELTMERLEVTVHRATGTCEAPLQLKSNGGTLVIDDFGRQRVSVEDLLNRWIVPLEKRYDYLQLPSGKTIQVPFDQLIVFSTNLEPKDLVDEAFLRRIPYKIDVPDPTEVEFRELFQRLAAEMGMEYRPEPVEHLIQRHYRATERPFRYCHPRDLMLQMRSVCVVNQQPIAMTNEHFDSAVRNYFAML